MHYCDIKQEKDLYPLIWSAHEHVGMAETNKEFGDYDLLNPINKNKKYIMYNIYIHEVCREKGYQK